MRNKKIVSIVSAFFAIIFLLILVSFLLWFFKPKKELNVFLLDKTVPTKERNEHKSFHWVLNHNRYVKPDKERYKLKEDYYGFFPTNPENSNSTSEAYLSGMWIKSPPKRILLTMLIHMGFITMTGYKVHR